MTNRLLPLLAGSAVLAACTQTTGPTSMDPVGTVAPTVHEVPCATHQLSIPDLRCYDGRDGAGSFVFVAVPARWNGVLVLHAHGGPFLGAPTMARVDEDVSRWAVVPAAGYAWAVTSYRQGGVAVRSAGADIERLHTIALGIVGKPKAVILHGQSWGGNVAAKEAELSEGRHLYDGVLLTSGVLAGGPRAYEHRFDLRVVYQYFCHNHPRPDEAQYPLWMGLPEGTRMTREDLAARADECLGTKHDAKARTPEQARRLHQIATVVRIPESSVENELAFATFTFADIAQRYHASVFGNIDAHYPGSDDDVALNAAVERDAVDPTASRAFADDTDLHGGITVPVLTMHAIRDPVAFVEMERRFGDGMLDTGHGANLVQTFSADAVHSYVSDATYVTLLDALTGWMLEGKKPSPTTIAATCPLTANRFPSTCRFRPEYTPATLETRVTDRRR
jgi:hypothetical protein